MDLKGKKVIITGAAGGIGQTWCQEFKKRGAEIIAIDRSKAELAKLPNKLTLKEYACDFNDSQAIVNLCQEIKQDFPVIDLLVNNAGVGMYKPLTELSWEEWQVAVNINVHAPFLMIKELLASIAVASDPLVINMGSGAGFMPMAERVAYCTTKFALRGMSLTLSEEYKEHKLKFVYLRLGSILTSFGGLSITEKKALQEAGKSYFTPEFVVEEVIKKIEADELPDEYVLYPNGYEDQWQPSTN